ncbi:glycine-rich domain-containing protein [Lysinibacillus sphaericus]|uniref:glycine-rich domain-containing protein n=1 Tax=Lysinibacillus sphaericus TaxID=1421 RepID=UPI001A9F9B59|nr:hypothetical protein [Lysinibacillus sphaericus]QTB28228.1 hypothetical protein J2D51_06215 [Lysinibacillus sphaericus]
MSTDTVNYGFKKDNEDEFYNVNVVNANLDKIDTEMKRIEDESKKFNQQVVDNTNAIVNANTKFDTHIKDDIGHTRYIGSTNAVNAWTCTSNLIIWDGTKPKAGVAYRLFAAGANTGAVTLVLSSTNPEITSSTYPVYGMDGKALAAGAVAQGAMVTVCFSGSAFFLQGSGSGVNAGTQNYQAYYNPGSYNFTVPDGVTRIIASMWGGGGGGGGASANNLYGGGGGGAGFFKEVLLQVLPGQSLSIFVAIGGSGGVIGGNGGAGQTTVITGALNGVFQAPGGGGGGSGQSTYAGYGGAAATANDTGASRVITGSALLKNGSVSGIPTTEQSKHRKLISGGTGCNGASGIGGGGGGSPSDMHFGQSGGINYASSSGGSGSAIGFYSTWSGGNGGSGQTPIQANGIIGSGGGGGSITSNGSALGGNGGAGQVILAW